MLTDIPDTRLDLAAGRRFDQPFAFEWQAFNTTGVRHLVKFDLRTLNVESDETDALGVTWYARR